MVGIKAKPLLRIVKLFKYGRSQAVRLPVDLRFDCERVYIRQDPATGDVILSRPPDSWESFFNLVAAADVPEDFLSGGEAPPPWRRELF